MRIDIITLFPEMFEPVLGDSIIGRAQKSGAIEIHTHQLRDFAFDKHRRVDDTPYGGGMGMLMKAEPIAAGHTCRRRAKLLTKSGSASSERSKISASSAATTRELTSVCLTAS